MKKFQVITLFPEMFRGVFENSMMWKAQDKAIVELSTINLRDFGLGPRHQVDDTPYGGGDGMLLMIEPLWNALMPAHTCSDTPSTGSSIPGFTASRIFERTPSCRATSAAFVNSGSFA